MPNPAPAPLSRRLLRYIEHPAWVARRLAWEFFRRTRPDVVIRTDVGAIRVRTTNRAIGAQLFTRRAYEADIMRGALEALAGAGHHVRGRTAVDVGANIGMTTLALLRLWGADRVIAIEPEARNVADLRDTLARNGVTDRVVIHQVAVTDRAGTVSLELADANFGDHRVRVGGSRGVEDGPYGEAARPVISVPAQRLDDLLAAEPDVAVLWVDVQGHDAAALCGARDTARLGVPAVTECWPYGLARAGVSRDEYIAVLAASYRSAVALGEDGRPGAAGPLAAVVAPVFTELAGGIADRTVVLLP